MKNVIKFNKTKGNEAESLALSFLLNNGLKLINKNFHSRHGEIDLIMMDQRSIVFVEVKFRSSNKFGLACESVSISKQKKIIATSNIFLQKNINKIHYSAIRFDIISINHLLIEDNISWIKNAFYCE